MTEAPAPSSLELNPTSLVGQLRSVIAWKAVRVAGMALFAVLAPRLMGAERFGQFAVILSVNTLWMTSSNFGARYVFGRFVPEYARRGATDQLRGLFLQVLGLRGAIVLVGAPLLFLFFGRVLPEATTLTRLAATGAFVATTATAPMFSFFYGLNRLGTSLSREAFARFLLLGAIVVAGGATSLERASLALVATQILILAAGVWLCRDLFVLRRAGNELEGARLHLGFGLAMFAANFLLHVPWRLGESALALAGVEPAEIAYFSVSLSAAVALTRILGETTTLQIPSLSRKQADGDAAGRDRSLGLGLRYLSILGVGFVFLCFAAGPWAVRTLWGESFLGVVPNLLIVAPAAVAVPFTRCALSLAVIESRLRRNFELGLAAMVGFAVTAVLLVPRLESRGASAAVVVGLGAAALTGLRHLRSSGVLANARLGRHVLAAALGLGLLALGGGTPVAALGGAALYLAALFAFGVLEVGEVVALAGRIVRAEG
jgi:O-antigen/teichoic acid export membrane protein